MAPVAPVTASLSGGERESDARRWLTLGTGAVGPSTRQRQGVADASDGVREGDDKLVGVELGFALFF